jgi:NAD(P)-dependent dehydrogenase (short-subunit alcohol dehydrogenase family)
VIEMDDAKRVVVTGGASGIGEATARVFHAAGWQIVLADIDAGRGAAVAAELDGGDGSCRFYRVDVSEEEEINRFAATVRREHGRVDALISSAGLLQNAVRVAEMAMEEFDRSWAVNVRGALLTARAFAPGMCEAGSGSIIHLCSLTTFRASAQVAYAMGKSSLRMLTEIMAAEYGPAGVRVNAVAPGYTLTPAMQSRIDRGERDPAAVIGKSALRRFVEPREVGETILFLCSDQASAITGITLPIDCGWLAYTAYSAYAAQP